MVKNLPAMWETWVLSLDGEDPLEKEMAAHSNILAWRIPWGHKELDMTERVCVSLFPITAINNATRYSRIFFIANYLFSK